MCVQFRVLRPVEGVNKGMIDSRYKCDIHIKYRTSFHLPLSDVSKGSQICGQAAYLLLRVIFRESRPICPLDYN